MTATDRPLACSLPNLHALLTIVSCVHLLSEPAGKSSVRKNRRSFNRRFVSPLGVGQAEHSRYIMVALTLLLALATSRRGGGAWG